MSDYDVAIIGYGPTGITPSLRYLASQVTALWCWSATPSSTIFHALLVSTTMMRTFQKLGLVGEMSRAAEVQRGYESVNAAGEILVDFEYDNPAPGGWAALYMMFQPYVEAVLDRHDKALSTVERYARA